MMAVLGATTMISGTLLLQKVFPRLFVAALLLAWLTISSKLSAATLVWTNTSSGNWNVAANWSPNQVPGPGDTATINSSVSVTNPVASSVGNLVFNSATFYGSTPLTVSGQMYWAGGDLCGAITIGASGTLIASNSVTLGYNRGSFNGGGALTNLGTAIWAVNSATGYGNAVLQNAGLWRPLANDNLGNASGTNFFFDSGDIEVTNSGVTTLSWTFNCTGTVNTAPGASLTIGSWTGTSSLFGSATLSMGTVNGSLTITSNSIINCTAGSVYGAISVTPGAVLNWSGGDLDGPLTISSGATLSISNNVSFGYNNGSFNGGGALTNFGLVICAGNSIPGYGNAVVNNQGLWEAAANDTFGNSSGTNTFINSATLEKTNSGAATFAWQFITTGTINATVGTFSLQNWIGTNTLHGTASLATGTMPGSLTIASDGFLTWLSGDLDGTFIVAPGGTLALSNNVTFGYNNGSYNGGGNLTNFGTVLWGGGASVTGYGRALIDNAASWQVMDNNNLNNATGTNFFINTGTITKTNSGTATISWYFNSTGTINNAPGATLSLGPWFGNTILNGNANLNFGTMNTSFTVASNAYLHLLSGDIIGSLVVAPGATLALSNSMSFGYNSGAENGGGSLTNFGTILWGGGISLIGYGRAVIDNAGSWQVLDNNNLGNNAGTNFFFNTGTITKTNSGAATIGWYFNSTGTVDTFAGSLTLGNWFSNTVINGTANLAMGTMNTSITVATNSSLAWLSGDNIGTLVVAPGGTLALSNGASFGYNNGTENGGGILTNFGTVLWGGGVSLAGYGGGFIYNANLWQITAGNNLSANGGTNIFINTGTLQKLTDPNTATIGWNFTNSGTVDSGSGALSMQGGFVQTAGQTVLAGGNLTVNPPMQLNGGILSGSNTISGTVTNNSVVKPGGDAAGLLNISGSYIQTAQGQLDIQLGGTNVGSGYDQLAVSSQISLNGTLDITLIDPFTPSNGNTFVALTFSSRTGDFSQANGLVLFTNLALQATYTSSALDLVAVTTNAPATPPVIVSQPQGETIINGQTASFTVMATGTRPLFYQWLFNSNSMSGQNGETLTIPNAQTNAAGNYQVVVTNSAGAVTSSVAVLNVQPIADLVITSPTNPTNAYTTEPATFTWTSLNQGDQTAIAPWTETIAISTNATGVPATIIASINVTNSLAAGQSVVRTQPVILPGGLSGTFYVVFTTDPNQTVVESDYTNNTTISPVPMAVHSPDLEPIDIVATASAQLGQAINVAWLDTNSGAAPIFTPWNDAVYLSTASNVISGATLLSTVSVTNLPLTNFASVSNGASVTLPLAENFSAGNYFLVVEVDSDNVIAESNETNNILSVPISLSLPPLPDLVPFDIAAPTTAQPGQSVTISWGVTNEGTATASGTWSETVFLGTNTLGLGATELATFTFTNALAPGASLSRTETVTVPPDSPLGAAWFLVEANSRGDIFEGNVSNSLEAATNSTLIPAQLTLQFPVNQVVKGAAPITGIVTRDGNNSSPLTVTLTNGNPTFLSMPAQVLIPSGQASVDFSVTPLNDGMIDGPQLVTVNAGAPGFNAGTAQITVLDAGLPTLTLIFQTNSVYEGQTVAVTVSRNGATNSTLTVNLDSSDSVRLVTPAQVIIPQGSYSNMFAVMAVDDQVMEPPTIFTLTASATNCNSGSANITMLDADVPQITLTLSSTNVLEGSGPQAIMATLQSSPIIAAPLYIELDSSDPASLIVPSLVTIPAAQGSVSFPIGAGNNTSLSGSESVEVDQWVRTTPAGPRVVEAAPVFVTVTASNAPALSLQLASTLLGKGLNPATTGTVSRNGGTNSALLVNLTSTDTTQATVPATVLIPAGASSVTFNVATLNDGLTGDTKSLNIVASATNFATATVALSVSDSSMPDLIVQSVIAPTNGDAQSFANIGYVIRNQGFGAMPSNSVYQAIYLSPDTLPGDGILEGVFPFNGGLPAGTQFGQSFSLQLPQAPGTYWVVVQADVSNAVAEVSKDNNIGVSAQPIQVNAPYNAIVSTTLTSAPANTPVPMTGHAFKSDNSAAPFVLVDIYIYVRGTTRVISAITDGSGNFSTTWQPLPGEAGYYQIGAVYPGYTSAPTQATFSLYGMNAAPNTPAVTLMGEESVTGAVEIINAGDLPLNAVTAQVVSPPADLNFNVSLMTNSIAGLSSNTLTYTINSTDGQAANGTVNVQLTSAEGAVLNVPFSVTVKPLVPQLVTTPSPLVRGMLPGSQTFASFTVTNVGGATSGPITISLPPGLSWVSLTSSNPVPALAPGQGATISLQLMPAANVALGDVTGNILLDAAGNVTSVPFDFRILSDGTGSLLVTSQDDFTFYEAGSPPLTNAAATLSDPTTGNVIASGITGTNGQWFASQIPEGYYNLQVTANQHTTYKGAQFIAAGVTNSVDAFLPAQTVQYIWTVVPTQVQDQYQIQVQLEFEANVPVPVVTIDPSVIDLRDMGDTTQVDLTVANHGLIAVDNFELQFDPYPGLTFTPLISDLGTLPAQSTFTIPLVITRTNQQSTGVRTKNGLSDTIAECFATARGVDNYPCGQNLNIQVTTITFPNAGTCLANLIPALNWIPSGGGPNNIYCVDCGQRPPPPTVPVDWTTQSGGGSGVLAAILNFLTAAAEKACPALVIPNPCDPTCLPKLALAIRQCNAPADPKKPDPCFAQGVAACARDATIDRTYNGAVDCASGAFKCWFNFCEKKTHTECLFAILEACAPPESKPLRLGPNDSTQPNDFTFTGQYADLLGTLQTRVDRIDAVNSFYDYFLGDEAWRDSDDETNLQAFFGQFIDDIDSNSDSGVFVSPAELSGLLSMTLPAGIVSSNVTDLVTRWNQSVTNWQSGIFTLADVPAGGTTNFLAFDQLVTLSTAATNAMMASEADGFSTLEAGVRAALGDIENEINLPGGGTCAHVQLQLDQQAVLSRDAFNATLQIVNTEGQPLQNMNVTIGVFDTNGNDASALFGIQPPTLTDITGTNGNGTLDTGQTGSLSWTLIPSAAAAPTNITRYFVSGGLNYTAGGNSVSVPMEPTPINVYPSPQLDVKYFCQRDVYADDPDTPTIEPSIPFALAVMVQNQGQGTAHNFQLTSAQPEIVDNEKGLLINFQIIASQVGNQSLQPTLTMNMGDIGPGTNVAGIWWMTSTLDGLFVNYDASFEDVDDLGSQKLSLINNVSIHQMIHVVDAAGQFEDGLPDFLVNDIPNINNFPDTLYLSQGTTNSVQVVTNDVITGTLSPQNLQVQLSASMPGGWVYLNVPDPGNGTYQLTGVTRSDGVTIYLNTNVWTTAQTFVGLSKPPILENVLHMLDYNSTGSYTLTYEPNPANETNPPTSSVAALPPQSPVGILLQWSGQGNPSPIATFDIYVSVDGGAFQPWVTGTTTTSGIYQGVVGNTYAFYSIATDQTGNRQSPPATPNATTTVTMSNSPPQIGAIANQTIFAGNTLSLTVTASDPDDDALTFSLGAGTPPGVQLDPHSGALTWVTGRSSVSSTNTVSVVVTDSGIPQMSTSESFQVAVLATNTPPSLAPIADVTISEEQLLVMTNLASDSNFPPPTLTFSLGPGAPQGMTLNANSGVLTWLPTTSEGGTTNPVTVIVSDNGNPPLTATQSFTVIVLNTTPDVVLNIGTTNLLVGTTATVPLELISGADLTNLAILLNVSSAQLTNFALSGFPAQVASAQIQPVANNQYELQFQSQPGARLQGDLSMANLGFGTTTNSNSVIVLLNGSMSGMAASSTSVLTGVINGGRVFLVGNQPLLDGARDSNQLMDVIVYGLPGTNYSLQGASALGGTNSYTVVTNFSVSNLQTILQIPIQQKTEFFRAQQLP